MEAQHDQLIVFLIKDTSLNTHIQIPTKESKDVHCRQVMSCVTCEHGGWLDQVWRHCRIWSLCLSVPAHLCRVSCQHLVKHFQRLSWVLRSTISLHLLAETKPAEAQPPNRSCRCFLSFRLNTRSVFFVRRHCWHGDAVSNKEKKGIFLIFAGLTLWSEVIREMNVLMITNQLSFNTRCGRRADGGGHSPVNSPASGLLWIALNKVGTLTFDPGWVIILSRPQWLWWMF